MDSRVGYAATSILEELTLDYIKAYTINNEYKGDVKYLLVYQQLKNYNEKSAHQGV